MNIIAACIDYNSARLEEREIFSFTKSEVESFYKILGNIDIIQGAALINTCNRTELYLSLKDAVTADPFKLLCDAKGVGYDENQHLNKYFSGDGAVRHLFMLAAGTESQIWGDAQIVSQIRESIVTARENKAADSVLNVLFRSAVSAGKKVKNLIDFKLNDNSTALRAINLIKERPDIKDVLIIGNGMIGRLVGELLVREGKNTCMTLRQYKTGAISIPRGVDTVNYADRYEKMQGCQAVISATLSPHYTLEREKLNEFDSLPCLFIDLAVPRDIDPEIEVLEEVEYYNIDDISKGARDESKEEQLKEIQEIVFEFEDDFYRWYAFRKNMILEGKLQ